MIKNTIRTNGGLRFNTGLDLNLGQLFSAKRGQRLGYISQIERCLPDMVWDVLDQNPSLRVEVVAGTQSAKDFATEMIAHRAGKTVKQVRDIETANRGIYHAWYQRVDHLLQRLLTTGRLSIVGLKNLARNQIFKMAEFAQKASIFNQALLMCSESAHTRLMIVKDADQLFGLEKGQKSSFPPEYVDMLRNLFLGRPGYALVNSERIADRIGFIMAKNFVAD